MTTNFIFQQLYIKSLIGQFFESFFTKSLVFKGFDHSLAVGVSA